MISYISLFGLSVLMHGKTPGAGANATQEAMLALRSAWAYVQTIPRGQATQSTVDPCGDESAHHDAAGESLPAGSRAHVGHEMHTDEPFVVLANSSQSSIVDDEPESEPQSEDVDAGETDPDWSDDEPDFDDAKSHESAQTDSVPPDATPGDYEGDRDDLDGDMADDVEDEPLRTKTPDTTDNRATTTPPPVDMTESDEPPADDGDFADFGSPIPTYSAPNVEVKPTPVAPPQHATMKQPNEVIRPAAQPVNEPPANGPAAQLRSAISIARMTLKDQPSELIRVAVNTSMVVDLSGPVDAANIVDPNVADIIVPAPNRVIVVGKSTGTTQLVLTIGQGQAQEHRVFHVYVEPNVVVLTDLIRSLAPRSDVRIGSLNGQLVLQGTVPDANIAKQIEDLARAYQGRDAINHLSVSGTQQTMLRVVVAEVNKEALRNLGFNWAIGASDWSRDFFFANNVGQLNPTIFSSSGVNNVLQGQQIYGVAPVGNGTQTNLTFGFPKAELQIFMNALRQNGLARTLAEPNLVAISGQTATFLAGGEVPIPVSQGGAVAGAITIEYKEFGVRLAFTPTVGADQIIRLHVMSEVSDAVPGSRQIDAIPVFTFRTRRVESTIECPNGKTFAIAGLLNESVNAIASKIPGLGDVPVLGQLFTSVDYQRSNTELVVLVTPNLVEALEPEQVPPAPGQMMLHPNDWELFGLGQLEGSAPPPDKCATVTDGESEGGTLVHKGEAPPTQARLQGVWGFEDDEPGALTGE